MTPGGQRGHVHSAGWSGPVGDASFAGISALTYPASGERSQPPLLARSADSGGIFTIRPFPRGAYPLETDGAGGSRLRRPSAQLCTPELALQDAWALSSFSSNCLTTTHPASPSAPASTRSFPTVGGPTSRCSLTCPVTECGHEPTVECQYRAIPSPHAGPLVGAEVLMGFTGGAAQP